MTTSDNTRGEDDYVKGKLCMNSGAYDEMLVHFQKAISQGHLSAMNDLAFYHHHVTKDMLQAIQYYKMAIDHGHRGLSAYNLGYLYYERNDQENKVKFWTIGAERGCTRSTLGLVVHFEDARDFVNMLKYAQMGVAQGQPSAMMALADYYKNISKDMAQAKQYYLQALRAGCLDAVYALDARELSLTSDESKEVLESIPRLLDEKSP